MFTGALILAGLANGSVYALVALGLVLIYKTQDMVNFAHGEMFMAGAFIGFTTFHDFGWPYPVAFCASVVGGGVLGAIIQLTMIRPLTNHPHVTLAMATVGISYAIRGVVRLYFGSDIHAFPPIFPGTLLQFHGLVLATQGAVNIAAALVLTAALLFLFQHTPLGRQIRATQQNSLGAKVVGIDTGRIYAITWGLSAAIGAAAGFLAAPVTLIYPDMGSGFLIKGFAAAVIGGFGSVPGAIAGGFLVGIIELLIGGFVSTSLIDVSSYILIIFVMMVRPQGLFGVVPASRV